LRSVVSAGQAQALVDTLIRRQLHGPPCGVWRRGCLTLNWAISLPRWRGSDERRKAASPATRGTRVIRCSLRFGIGRSSRRFWPRSAGRPKPPRPSMEVILPVDSFLSRQ
jgi:hypothetical protein